MFFYNGKFPDVQRPGLQPLETQNEQCCLKYYDQANIFVFYFVTVISSLSVWLLVGERN